MITKYFKRKFGIIIFIIIIAHFACSLLLMVIFNYHLLLIIVLNLPIISMEGIVLTCQYNKENRKIDLNFYQGTGIPDDPILIDSVEQFPEHPIIFKSDLYIMLRDCDLSELSLFYSKNITITSCNINKLFLGSCSDIRIDNSSIFEKIEINKGKKTIIRNTSINQLILKYSELNKIQNCVIEEIFKIKSDNNIFE